MTCENLAEKYGLSEEDVQFLRGWMVVVATMTPEEAYAAGFSSKFTAYTLQAWEFLLDDDDDED